MPTHILIVEDEPGIVDNIEFVLRQEQFDCSHAVTVAAARDILQAQHIDLIILDIGLPDLDGFSFCRELRQGTDRAHNVPIIFLTARADVTDRIVGLELGADDYMVKPFSPRELSARVKAILRRQDRNITDRVSEDISIVMPFDIDEEKRRIFYFGQELPLARYEYDMLCYMLRQPGRVYSRSELMDAVWDEPSSSYDRTVDTHIKVLRGKLQIIRPEIAAIITHRGIGYSLRDEW